jgi:transcriptional regulator with XRE-family HTH domain
LDTKIIGKVIRSYRKSKGLTLEVVSGLADLDSAHLARIELGEYVPNISTFIKIAKALGLKASELMAMIEASEIQQ